MPEPPCRKETWELPTAPVRAAHVFKVIGHGFAGARPEEIEASEAEVAAFLRAKLIS